MAARIILSNVARIPDEPEIVTIEVELSGKDMANVRRILGPQFEPQAKAWLVVKVKKV
jgi:hypothetical protein